MDKALKFPSLSSLVLEYKNSYHVSIGYPLDIDTFEEEAVKSQREAADLCSFLISS